MDGSNRSNLKEEVLYNLKQIKYRFKITLKLLYRFLFKSKPENIFKSDWGYDDHYEKFWKRGDYFKILKYSCNDVALVPPITPFAYKKACIVKILSEEISRNNFKNILEVGSGSGSNILMLAPLFPNVKFTGIEPAESGVKIANKFIETPPQEYEEAFKIGKIRNAKCIKGNILDKESFKEIVHEKYDLVYTAAVLEQLHDYIDIAFNNIFSLGNSHFLFFEQWLEANYLIENYHYLVYNNYFRFSWNYLHKFKDIETLERSIPPLQPYWLKYGVVVCKKTQ